eukprot:Blabericola_migrator_1__5080@NODE_262_length_10689_cov_220_487008_g219_i0_p7_GENE_NODE_262_length_10689_cov_220_487008_g219_i0NODE_262_length_10689_cov_220_487008_g219_i0_p7_ORF_typecomplete_len151_score15_48_NODE_262_length_10689_cov_220_487008_g219_i056446096
MSDRRTTDPVAFPDQYADESEYGDGCCGRTKEEDANPPVTNREEFLNTLFARDPERLWPAPRVFVPVWKEAGVLHAVVRVDQDNIPESCYGDGERPQGSVVEPFDVHHGKYYPVDDEFVEQKTRAAQFDAAQRRRAEKTERRAARSARRG